MHTTYTHRDTTNNNSNTYNNKIIGTDNQWSLIALIINGVDSLIKKKHTKRKIRLQDQSCCIQQTYLNIKDRHYLRVRGWERFFKQMVPRGKLV